jgi:hypothetical protein
MLKSLFQKAVVVICVFVLYLPVFADKTNEYRSPLGLVLPAAATVLTVFVASRVGKRFNL